MINFNLPSSLKYILRTTAFVVFSFSFMRGCDPVTALPWKIENQTDSQIEVMLYGLGEPWRSKKDSLRILEPGEVFTVFHEEQMGTRPGSSRKKSVNFIDSIRVTHLDKSVVATRDYMDRDEWMFINKSQMLIIREQDFE